MRLSWRHHLARVVGGKAVTSLQFYFLGPLDLRSGGQRLPRPPTLKSQSLLAYLALHRDRPQPRDRLVGLFWAERPERNARRSLSTALWHIRRCLPDDAILIADVHAVQFDRQADLWIDVEAFEVQVCRTDAASLVAALDLYRGDLLEGFYDDWILGERYRLESLCIEALARLMAAHEAAGDQRSALATAQRLLARDPLREDAHRLAMRAYSRLGRRNAALEQYERCREIVRAELGAEPTDETRALYKTLLSGEFEVEPVPETPFLEAPFKARGGRSPLDVIAPVRLVGREHEMGLLREAWERARTGHRELVLLGGEAGVGKTRLVQEFANRLRWQGARVLSGRCYEFERALPYQPFGEALHAALPALSDDELTAFPHWAVAELARLVPEVQERIAWTVDKAPAVRRAYERDKAQSAPEPKPLALDQEQMRLFEGVTHLLAAMASRVPLLLLLEDLHWAGESTLGLLHHLARHLAGRPVLIVGTFRPEATGTEHPLQALRRRLAREGLARLVHLSRLPAAAVETMIVEMSGAGETVVPLARRLYRETEGNPFFLIEIVKALFETGVVRLEEGIWQGDFARISAGALPLPASVSEAIQARARRLDASTQEALGLAAVLGREFDFDLLNAAWGRGDEATLEALDCLLRQRLVQEGEGAGSSDFAFTHHKIQEVVYEAMPRPRRLHWHARAGMAMESVYPASLEARSGELAHHFERACLADRSLCDRTVTYLLQAGRQAVRQSAHQEAIAYYHRALDILHTLPEAEQRARQETELQLALAQPTAVVYGYPAPETGRVYERVRHLGRALGQTPALFTSLVGLCRFYGVGGDIQTGMGLAEQLLAIAHSAQEDTLLLEAYRQMGGYLFCMGRLQEARGFWQQGITLYDVGQHERLANRFGHDPAATCLAYLSMTLWLLGYPDQAQEQERELSALMSSMTHASSLGCGQSLLAMQACMRHDLEATLDHAEAALGLGQRHGLPSWTAMATALRGWALIERGEGAEGDVQLQEGTARWRARGFAHFSPFLLGLQAEARLKRAMLEEAAAALSEANALTQNGDRYWVAELERLEGELARAQGRNGKEAEARFRRAIDTARQQEARMLELRAAVSLARLWRAQGRGDEARELLAEVCGWFTEGFDTMDLAEAEALLEALE
jgi:predicted ATPase/DNA-binding SARP family transcriptional activator